MFETILVPLDGSELAESALPVALELMQKFGSRLLLVRTLEPQSHRLSQAPALFESPAEAASNVQLLEQIMASERAGAKAYLDATVQKLASPQVEALIVEGHPPDVIVSLAQERGASLIIMSSHGRGGLGRLVFGSVADVVLRHSKTPVLLMRSAPGKP